MNIFDAIESWKSTRKFKPDPIDDRMIGVLLHMAINASSAGNIQCWEFVVVRDEKLKEKLAIAALHQELVKDAPVDIIVCANLERASLKYGKRGELFYSIQDTAAAAEIILLTATALGLGSEWVRAFDEERVKDILLLPETVRPVGIIPIGYPLEQEKERRISFEDITHVENYGKKYQISFATQPGIRDESGIKPIGNIIQDEIKKKKPGLKEKLKISNLFRKKNEPV